MQSDQVPRRAAHVRETEQKKQTSAPHRLSHLIDLLTNCRLLSTNFIIKATFREFFSQLLYEVLAGQDTHRLLDKAKEELSSFEVYRELGKFLMICC